MKIKMKILRDFNLKYIFLDAHIRYPEDGSLNGVECKPDGSDTPFYDKKDERIKLTINAETGEVLDYPKKGREWSMYYKVCDECRIELLDENKESFFKYDDYVPDFLAIEDEGYGDYIIMKVSENGFIENWKLTRKDIEDFIDNED